MEKEFIVPLDKSKSILEQLMNERKELEKIEEEIDKKQRYLFTLDKINILDNTVTDICIRISEIISSNRKNETSGNAKEIDEIYALANGIAAIKAYRSILFSLKNPVSRDTNGIQH